MASVTLSNFGTPFFPLGYNPALIPSAYQLLVANSNLALDLTLVKNALRIDEDDTSEDTLLTLYVKSATDFCEKYTGRDLLQKTYIGYCDTFPNLNVTYTVNGTISGYIQLQKSALIAINSIQYYSNGVLTTFDSDNYYTSFSNNYCNIYCTTGSSWPTNVDCVKQAVQINFDAGYGETNTSIPNDLKEGLLQHIAQMYENRGDCTSETPSANKGTVIASLKIPEQTKNIYEMYKIQLVTYNTIY